MKRNKTESECVSGRAAATGIEIGGPPKWKWKLGRATAEPGRAEHVSGSAPSAVRCGTGARARAESPVPNVRA